MLSSYRLGVKPIVYIFAVVVWPCEDVRTETHVTITLIVSMEATIPSSCMRLKV